MRRTIRRRLEITVRFDETDMLGVVHNSVYFRYFERGRLELLEELLPVGEAMATGIAAMVVRNLCDYEAPARYRDELVLTTRMLYEEPYEGRIRFLHGLDDRRTRRSVARGETDVALVTAEGRRLVRDVPEPMLRRVRAALGIGAPRGGDDG